MNIDYNPTEKAQLERKARERARRDLIGLIPLVVVVGILVIVFTNWS